MRIDCTTGLKAKSASCEALVAALVAATVVLATPASSLAQDAGERLFRQRCASCHSLDAGQNRIGPHLNGVIGRAAGSVEGARYSNGMRELGITWDAAQIGAYIANPRAMVPGSTMTVSIRNEADRASIVAYLETRAAAN